MTSKSKIVITSTEKKKKYEMQSDKTLPQLTDFGWIVYGKPRSGKTELVLKLIKEYQKDFDIFIIVSPPPIDDKIKHFEFYRKEKNCFGDEKIIQVETNLDNIPKLVKQIKSYIDFPEQHQPKNFKQKDENGEIEYVVNPDKEKWVYPRVLVFFDDMTGEKIWSKTSSASKFYYRRRQFNCSVIIVMHDYKQISPTMRRTSDIITLFGMMGSELVDDIIKENTLENRDEMKEIVKNNSKIPHSFVSWYKHNNRFMVGFDYVHFN